MASRDYLKFYGDEKYWNQELKEDFLSQTRSLWLGNADKYGGRIFNLSHRANEQVTLSCLKVDAELQAAIKKHGEVEPPKSYEDQFYERVNENKKKFA